MRIVRDIDTDIGEDSPPERVVAWMLQRFAGRRLVMTTAFGMEGCALIDMIARPRRRRFRCSTSTPASSSRRPSSSATGWPSAIPHLSFENRGTSLTPGGAGAPVRPRAVGPRPRHLLQPPQGRADARTRSATWTCG